MPSPKRMKDTSERQPHAQQRCDELPEENASRNATRVSCRVPTHKRTLAREMWLVLLVLVAQSLSDIANLDNALSTELIANTHDFTGKPTLKDDYIFSSYYETMQTPKAGAFLQFADLSEGITSSSGDSTDSSDHGDEDDERELTDTQSEGALSRISALATSGSSVMSMRNRFNTDDAVWENIYSFLPWQCVMQVRGISRFHFRQSMGFVSVMRMPMSKLPAMFIPCREDLDTEEMAVEAALQLPNGPWACSHCGQHNAGSRSLCGNPHCQAGRQLTGCRLFMGQLRRDGTVPMVKWLVNYVLNAPAHSLISVENRRNAQNQRGKGCAWPTIADDDTVNRLLDSHHRLFFDSVSGVEGVWVVPKGAEASLEKETAMRPDKQHLKHLPRGPMAIELPAGASHPAQLLPAKSIPTPRSSTSAGPTSSATHDSRTPSATPSPMWYHATAPFTADTDAWMQAQGYYDSAYYSGPYRYYDEENAVVYETPTTYRRNPYNPIAFGLAEY